jgi:anti-sigma B factor antagonist
MVKNTTKQDKHCIFCPQGDLTIYTAQRNKEALLQVMSDCKSLSVDLSKVMELDTAGVQILLLAMVEAKRKDIPVEFYGHTESVSQVLELCNLSNVIGNTNTKKSEESRGALS